MTNRSHTPIAQQRMQFKIADFMPQLHPYWTQVLTSIRSMASELILR
jgi:hypothetical protein